MCHLIVSVPRFMIIEFSSTLHTLVGIKLVVGLKLVGLKPTQYTILQDFEGPWNYPN